MATVIDLIRHVRTPEGAAFYGLPIGAPITRDVVLRRMQMAKSKDNPLKMPNLAKMSHDERAMVGQASVDMQRRQAQANRPPTRTIPDGRSDALKVRPATNRAASGSSDSSSQSSSSGAGSSAAGTSRAPRTAAEQKVARSKAEGGYLTAGPDPEANKPLNIPEPTGDENKDAATNDKLRREENSARIDYEAEPSRANRLAWSRATVTADGFMGKVYEKRRAEGKMGGKTKVVSTPESRAAAQEKAKAAVAKQAEKREEAFKPPLADNSTAAANPAIAGMKDTPEKVAALKGLKAARAAYVKDPTDANKAKLAKAREAYNKALGSKKAAERPEDKAERLLKATRAAQAEYDKNPTNANKAKLDGIKAEYIQAGKDYYKAQEEKSKAKQPMTVVRPKKEATSDILDRSLDKSPARPKTSKPAGEAAAAKKSEAKKEAPAKPKKTGPKKEATNDVTTAPINSPKGPSKPKVGSEEEAALKSKRLKERKGTALESKAPKKARDKSKPPSTDILDRKLDTAPKRDKKAVNPALIKPAEKGLMARIKNRGRKPQPTLRKPTLTNHDREQKKLRAEAREDAIARAQKRFDKARAAYDKNANGANRTELERARRSMDGLISKRNKQRDDDGLERDDKYAKNRGEKAWRGGPGSDKEKQEDRDKIIQTKHTIHVKHGERDDDERRRRRRRKRRGGDMGGPGMPHLPKNKKKPVGTPKPGAGKPGVGKPNPMPGKPGLPGEPAPQGAPGVGTPKPNPNPQGVEGGPKSFKDMVIDEIMKRLREIEQIMMRPKKAGISASDKNAMDALSQERSALIAERDRRFASGSAQSPSGESSDVPQPGGDASIRAGAGAPSGVASPSAKPPSGAAMGLRTGNNYRGATRVARNGTVRNVDNDKVYGKVIHKANGVYAQDVKGNETGPYPNQYDATNYLRRLVAATGATRPSGGSLEQRSNGMAQSTAARQTRASDAVDGLPLGAKVMGRGPDGSVYAQLPDGTKAVFRAQANGGLVRSGGTWDQLPPGVGPDGPNQTPTPSANSGVSANSAADADDQLRKAGLPLNVADLVKSQATELRAMMNTPGDTVPIRIPGRPGEQVQISKALVRDMLAQDTGSKRSITAPASSNGQFLSPALFDALEKQSLSPQDRELTSKARTAPGTMTPDERAQLADLLKQRADATAKSDPITARRLEAGAAVMDKRKRPAPHEQAQAAQAQKTGGDVIGPGQPLPPEVPEGFNPTAEVETRQGPDGNIQIWLGNRQIGLFLPGAQAGPGAGTLSLPGGKRQDVPSLDQAIKNAWADSTSKAVRGALRGAGFKGVQTAVLAPQGEGFRVDVTADGRIQITHVGDVGGNEGTYLGQYKQALQSQNYIVQQQPMPAILWVLGKAAAGILRTKGTNR